MPKLLLGPLVRYVSDREATVWVEADGSCEVEVLGHSAPTFAVAGHHYALVRVEGLDPGSRNEYEVSLNGKRAWPEPGSEFPPSVISTLDPGAKTDLIFASCRVALPHRPPYTLPKGEDERGREIDALYVLARQMLAGDRTDIPEAILMLGDQVYADEVSPRARAFIEGHRESAPGVAPLDEVADFEEYTHLYRESWGEPTIRWLLSTVSTSMVFDDHDMHDDWNISGSWLADMRSAPWWHDRITGGFMSYWIYQHIGNLSPSELADDETYRAVTAAGDATAVLRDLAVRADRETTSTRWSFSRDFGGTRVLMIDSRGGRVLKPDARSMLDEGEWEWVVEHATGDFDHLVLGTSLPFVLAPGMHHLEGWNEAVCDGAWGERAARAGEWVRRTLDLEHWAAFRSSFDRLCRLLEEIGSGRRGACPASIVIVSGDVHYAYLAEIAFRRSAGVRSPVYQAVCSPMRNPLDQRERRAIRFGASPAAHAIGRALARAAGVEDPRVRWRVLEGPWFSNQVATLKVRGREASVRLDKTVSTDGEEFELERVFDRPLTGSAPDFAALADHDAEALAA